MLQLTNPEGYFGSGVVVIDFDALRLREIHSRRLVLQKSSMPYPTRWTTCPDYGPGGRLVDP